MNAVRVVLYIMGGSFLVVDAIYVGWNLLEGTFEWIGTLTMGLSAVMCLMFAFYFSIARGRATALLPEDRLDANIDDGDPEIGYFSPWSWWPILLAGGISIVFLGLAIGPWLATIGAPLVVVSIVGWVFEYYRGNFGR